MLYKRRSFRRSDIRRRVEGKTAPREFFSAFIFPASLNSDFLNGMAGLMAVSLIGNGQQTGAEIACFLGLRGVSTLKLRDGLITRQTDFWDPRNALRRLGMLDR